MSNDLSTQYYSDAIKNKSELIGFLGKTLPDELSTGNKATFFGDIANQLRALKETLPLKENMIIANKIIENLKTLIFDLEADLNAKFLVFSKLPKEYKPSYLASIYESYLIICVLCFFTENKNHISYYKSLTRSSLNKLHSETQALAFINAGSIYAKFRDSMSVSSMMEDQEKQLNEFMSLL